MENSFVQKGPRDDGKAVQELYVHLKGVDPDYLETVETVVRAMGGTVESVEAAAAYATLEGSPLSSVKRPRKDTYVRCSFNNGGVRPVELGQVLLNNGVNSGTEFLTADFDVDAVEGLVSYIDDCDVRKVEETYDQHRLARLSNPNTEAGMGLYRIFLNSYGPNTVH